MTLGENRWEEPLSITELSISTRLTPVSGSWMMLDDVG